MAFTGDPTQQSITQKILCSQRSPRSSMMRRRRGEEPEEASRIPTACRQRRWAGNSSERGSATRPLTERAEPQGSSAGNGGGALHHMHRV